MSINQAVEPVLAQEKSNIKGKFPDNRSLTFTQQYTNQTKSSCKFNPFDI